MTGSYAEALAMLPRDSVATDLDAFDYIEETLRRWHDEAHAGGWATCREQPCHALQVAIENARYLPLGGEE